MPLDVPIPPSPAWNSPAKIKATIDAGIVVVLRRVVVVVEHALEQPTRRDRSGKQQHDGSCDASFGRHLCRRRHPLATMGLNESTNCSTIDFVGATTETTI
jgi:hypothetical protein